MSHCKLPRIPLEQGEVQTAALGMRILTVHTGAQARLTGPFWMVFCYSGPKGDPGKPSVCHICGPCVWVLKACCCFRVGQVGLNKGTGQAYPTLALALGNQPWEAVCISTDHHKGAALVLTLQEGSHSPDNCSLASPPPTPFLTRQQAALQTPHPAPC